MSTLHPTYTDDIFNLSIPVLAVDIVLFTLYKDQLCVVLVPGRNEWAKGRLTLPGGIIGRGETLDIAADRILYRDTNIWWVYKEQLYTFSAPGRDDRGDVISCSYYTLVGARAFLSQIDLTKVSLMPYTPSLERDGCLWSCRYHHVCLPTTQVEDGVYGCREKYPSREVHTPWASGGIWDYLR
jgi:ADP-ribose pyrophosphatase YjhB (NUDIX family)